jgi:hypothetical protein
VDASMRRLVAAVLLVSGLAPEAARAYTAAGDRIFVGTLILPQIAPTDAFWGTLNTQPMSGGQSTLLTGTWAKTITERLGIFFEDGATWQGSSSGAQNLNVRLQYQAVLDQPHEFLMSFGLSQDIGGTGNPRVGSFQQSATQPDVTFGKGFGDVPIGYLRPLALTGFAGFQFAEGSRPNTAAVRPNTVNIGFSVQYSIPYLVSKVTNPDLPPVLRGMTPIVEVFLSTPAGRGHGQSTTLVVAPGFSFTQGDGWEFAAEALIPTTRATGTGVGVIAQLVLQLDYLLPTSLLGRPLFPRP